MKRKKIKFKNENLFISIYTYENNNRLCLLAETNDNDCYCDITVNLPEYLLADSDYVFVDSLAKDIGLIDKLQKAGLFTEKFGSYPCNYINVDMYKIDLEELKKYDLDGFQKYFLEIGEQQLDEKEM